MPRNLSEFDLIARYFAPLCAPNAFGLLDDAAIITPLPHHDLVVTKDMLVADVHFFEHDPADAIAAKALRVNLSDLAAKGAQPVGFLLGLALPKNVQPEWLEQFAAGLKDDIATYTCPLLGGDTVASNTLMISITAFGTLPTSSMVRRTTMQAGDTLYVTGTIGDAALGLQARLNMQASWVNDHILNRYIYPQPRCALAEIVRLHASACMDISDGFVGDLTKMLAPNALEMCIAFEDIPLSNAAAHCAKLSPSLIQTILSGGDDYELIIAVSPQNQKSFEAAIASQNIPVTKLSTATQAESCLLMIFDKAGKPLEFTQKSYVHF